MFILKCDMCHCDIQSDFENTCARIMLDDMVYRGGSDLIQAPGSLTERKIICPECKKKIYELLHIPIKSEKT